MLRGVSSYLARCKLVVTALRNVIQGEMALVPNLELRAGALQAKQIRITSVSTFNPTTQSSTSTKVL